MRCKLLQTQGRFCGWEAGIRPPSRHALRRDLIVSGSHPAGARLNGVRAEADGWEAGIRTPISRVRVCCPTVERPPNSRRETLIISAKNSPGQVCGPKRADSRESSRGPLRLVHFRIQQSIARSAALIRPDQCDLCDLWLKKTSTQRRDLCDRRRQFSTPGWRICVRRARVGRILAQ